MKRKKNPALHEENGPKKEKKGLPHERKGPSKWEKKHPTYFFFSRVELERVETYELAPPPWSPISENDNKMNNIFRNYSSHNYIKNTH